MPLEDRRQFLKALTGGALGLSLVGGTTAASGQGRPSGIAVTRLDSGLTLISGGGGNVVVSTGSDGVLMVDSGAPGRTDALLETVLAETEGRPVDILFNTHWHPGHTGGNAVFGKAGARIMAHENTRLWMDTTVHIDWQDRTYTPRLAAALPTHTFYESGEMTFNGERITYGHLPRAHTDGDIYVHFTGANVLVAGGMVTVGRYPILDYATGGWIRGLKEATQALIDRTNTETRVIPARGPIQAADYLKAQHAMLAEMEKRIIAAMKEGLSPEEIVAKKIAPDFDEAWGDSERFIKNAYWGIWGHIREIEGVV